VNPDSLLAGASIDHVELYVPDRAAAAAWYGWVFGLRPVAAHADWATPLGPLMLTADGGATMIALFTGDPRRADVRRSQPRVAFRVEGARFLAFAERALEGPIYAPDGTRLSTLTPVDHRGAFSVYFADPWGHLLEVTTYDWQHVVEQGRPEWIGDSRQLLALRGR
jgi:catechol 2,3-dioxygenase-like lactoylglutathione lyase family enzyme